MAKRIVSLLSGPYLFAHTGTLASFFLTTVSGKWVSKRNIRYKTKKTAPPPCPSRRNLISEIIFTNGCSSIPCDQSFTQSIAKIYSFYYMKNKSKIDGEIPYPIQYWPYSHFEVFSIVIPTFKVFKFLTFWWSQKISSSRKFSILHPCWRIFILIYKRMYWILFE